MNLEQERDALWAEIAALRKENTHLQRVVFQLIRVGRMTCWGKHTHWDNYERVLDLFAKEFEVSDEHRHEDRYILRR